MQEALSNNIQEMRRLDLQLNVRAASALARLAQDAEIEVA
jgi:hypothetical protein